MPYEKLIQTYEGTYKDRFGNEYELEGGTYYKLYPAQESEQEKFIEIVKLRRIGKYFTILFIFSN